MTQQELAKKLHVDRTVITKVELGILKNPSYSLVKEWARATDSMDVIGMEFNGIEGYQKLKTYKEKLDRIKEIVSFFKINRKKVKA